jgi:Eukaryotic aspartyl protease
VLLELYWTLWPHNTSSEDSLSLYCLNDFDAPAGSLLPGGVDITKYTGDLVTPSPSKATRPSKQYSYAIALTSLSLTDSSGETTQLTPANYSAALNLDSGPPNVWIDQDTFTRLALGFGAVETDSSYLVPCNLADASGTLNYRLGGDDGITIKVPLSHWASPPAKRTTAPISPTTPAPAAATSTSNLRPAVRAC